MAVTAGTYIDKKCPFTGNISIRGRILSGVVKSTKMNKTIIVRRNYVHYIKKYARCVSFCNVAAVMVDSMSSNLVKQSLTSFSHRSYA